MDDVARVDQPQADSPGDRRGDAAVRQLEPGVVDLRLIGLDGPFVLAHEGDRKSTRLNSSHVAISYAVFCLKKKNETETSHRSPADAFSPLHPCVQCRA